MVTDTTPKGPEPLRVIRGLVLMIAALFLIAAIYYYFVPVHVTSKEGVFGCGSASNPPNADKDGFQFGACQKSAVVNQFRTYAFLGAAVITALGAFLIFRTPRADDWDEDIDLAERERGEARRGDRRSERGARGERSVRADSTARSDSSEGSRTLRGARREEPAARVAADDQFDEPAPVRGRRSEPTDDWDDAVTEEAPARRTRRDDDFLDDETDEGVVADEAPPRRARRRRDDDF